ncbi:MAG: lysylphosphatidylglycerol synthase domain-containing protein, partial [Ignavibacteria bacterium]|nr:lysylphosphatidylglycerol synthase domain-containing protein [Ignavibacteria bacterium]
MKTKVSKSTNILLRILIMLFTFGFVYKQILEKNDLSAWLDIWKMIANVNEHYIVFACVILLFPLNIFIESLKWKMLIDKLEAVKIPTAFIAVLSGISVSMFLPNRIGDYFGRVFVLKHASHIKGILITIIGSIAQLLTTIILGFIGLIAVVPALYDMSVSTQLYLYIGMVIVLLLVTVFLIAIFLNMSILNVIVGSIFKKWNTKIQHYTSVFLLYSKIELAKVFAYSVFRYIVFSFQFFLLLRIFGFSIPYFEAIMLISIVYLVITIIPTIAITELAVRGSVAIGVFGMYFEHAAIWTEKAPVAVMAASSALWIINLALPALLGA